MNIVTRIRASRLQAAPEDHTNDLENDHGLEQPGVTIQPQANVGGNGASSITFAKASVKLNASARIRRIRAMQEDEGTLVQGDAFEGWINSLQYRYQRPEGEDYVILDADPGEVLNKLKGDGWIGTEKGHFTKGEHEVQVHNAGQGKTKITSIH